MNKEHSIKHIAIIMDGNGRWAQQRGHDRSFGHQNGIEAVRSVVEGTRELEIPYLTLYTFSTENWAAPKRKSTCSCVCSSRRLLMRCRNWIKTV